MILAIDIGNTTVALGGIKDGRVCFVAHMDTVRTRTAAEYRAEMEKVFAHRRHPEKPIRFEGAVLTSVVPQITGALAECARYYTGKKPVIVLQYTEDARRWSRRREELVRAFRAEYVTPTGRLVSETQTALILALHFDMVPDEFRPRLLDALEKNIGAHKTHLLTGDRKSTRLNSSHRSQSRMPSSA